MNYLVVTDLVKGDAYYKAALRLADHRKGGILAFDPDHLEELALDLREKNPRYVALVTRPETIHTNFIRRFLMMSTSMDEDPFSDFSWGIITGATAGETVAFVERMIAAEKEGLPRKVIDSYVSLHCSSPSGATPDWLQKAGYAKAQLGFGCEDARQVQIDFVNHHLQDLEGQGLIRMTGCGDPERIWLFDDQRNMDESKHWDYRPDRIGWNPDREMFWIDAPMIRELDLYPAVLFSGTCHCGSLAKVFVENDIISTFGRTERVEVYDMPADNSLGLAFLSSGVTAAILPVGPNHGWRTCVEAGRIFQTGAPLGEVVKSCHDELVLACNGPIELGLYEPQSDQAADRDLNAIMRGGAANRVLFGDPAYAPFKAISTPALTVSEPCPRGNRHYQVDCEIRIPFDYGDDRTAQWVEQFSRYRSRIFFTIPLPSDLWDLGIRRVSFLDRSGPAQDCEVRWAEEKDHGLRKLHIMLLSMEPPEESFLCAKQGQIHSLLIEPAMNRAERMRVSPPMGEAALKLEERWAYEWKDRRFGEVLDFIEALWSDRKNSPVAKVVKFQFQGDAVGARDSVVSMKLDSEPLKAGLERVCSRLGLACSVDETRWFIRFTKNKAGKEE